MVRIKDPVINKIYKTKSTSPSTRSSLFLPQLPKKVQSRIVDNKTKTIVSEKIIVFIMNGDTRITIPSIRVMFIKQEPIIFPTARFL